MSYTIPKRKLGKTDMYVTEVALGGAGIGSNDKVTLFGRPCDDKTAIATVIFALENGINLIDTSPLYGDAERKMGIAFREFLKRHPERRENFYLSSKAGTHPDIRGYSGEIFRKSVENSLDTLGVDYLDILHIHDPKPEDLGRAMGLGGALEEMVKLRNEGKVRSFGLGERNHDLHRVFIGTGYADSILTWMDYNLLRQTAEPLINFCGERDVGVMIGSPLCQGLLSGEDPRKIPLDKHHHPLSKEFSMEKAARMYDWCAERKVNLQQINNQFILDNSNVSTLLIGAASPKEVEENIETVIQEVDENVYNEFLEDFGLNNS